MIHFVPCLGHQSPVLRRSWEVIRGLADGVFDRGPTGRRFESALCRSTFTSVPPWSMAGYIKALVCPAVSLRLDI